MDELISRQDAITVLRNLQDWLYYSSMNGGTKIQREAIDIAILALQQPKIIRCKDCRLYTQPEQGKVYGWCTFPRDSMPKKQTDFCSYAKMRGEQNEP